MFCVFFVPPFAVFLLRPRYSPLDCESLWGWQSDDVASAVGTSKIIPDTTSFWNARLISVWNAFHPYGFASF